MGQSAYRYLLVLMVCLVLLNNRCYAGEINDKGAPPPPVTKETLATKRKRKANEVLNKALVYLSYLNYSDRTYDRVLKGIDKYEPYRAKIIGRITISILQPFGVTIDRPQPEKISKVEKFANKVQFKT
ncbi:MAG TPA: hypothetical protein VG603_15735, partial [Chitinophagales bacterium]|nr:hypothetical protein [Chitinophagales bacterium]